MISVKKLLFFVVHLDGKSYDAFLMCYKSDTDAGLNDDDRKWLESVMEEKFSYSLCLFDRDVLPGRGMCLMYYEELLTGYLLSRFNTDS